MSGFFSTIGSPVEPCLDVYELDHRDPCVRIDKHGSLWRSSIEPLHLPKILFADVPVMIHTSYGFSLSPMEMANAQTGPEITIRYMEVANPAEQRAAQERARS